MKEFYKYDEMKSDFQKNIKGSENGIWKWLFFIKIDLKNVIEYYQKSVDIGWIFI